MADALLIYNGYPGGEFMGSIDSVMDANLRSTIDGEFTLSFRVMVDSADYLRTGYTVMWGGDYFSIVRTAKSISGGLMICEVECEHVSYALSDMMLAGFNFTGALAAGLEQLFYNTPFSVGEVEISGNVTLAVSDEISRRAAMMQLIANARGEIEYDGLTINVRAHRGSAAPVDLMDTRNVSDLAVTYDSRSDTSAYEITLYQYVGVGVGDEVHILYSPLKIEEYTRIIAVEYNPFYRYTVRVEVGTYVPDIVDSFGSMISDGMDGLRQEFILENGVLASRITDAEGNISSLDQTLSGLSVTVSSLGGDVSEVQQTANSLSATVSALSGDVSKVQQTANSLSATVSALNGNVSTVQQTADNLSVRLGSAENNITFLQFFSDRINWLISSGTDSSNFQMTSRAIDLVAQNINLTGYVTFNALSSAGATTINGSNIVTGTLNATLIAANNGGYIQFAHPIMSTSVYGLQSLYFGGNGLSYFSRPNDTYSAALEIYGYVPVRFLYNHPVVNINGTDYPLISSYNISSYIPSATAVFG